MTFPTKEAWIKRELKRGVIPTDEAYHKLWISYKNFNVENNEQEDFTPVQKYFKENHVIAKLIGTLVGGVATVVGLPLGSVVGSATTLGLQQVGLGLHKNAHKQMDNWNTIKNNYPL